VTTEPEGEAIARAVIEAHARRRELIDAMPQVLDRLAAETWAGLQRVRALVQHEVHTVDAVTRNVDADKGRSR